MALDIMIDDQGMGLGCPACSFLIFPSSAANGWFDFRGQGRAGQGKEERGAG